MQAHGAKDAGDEKLRTNTEIFQELLIKTGQLQNEIITIFEDHNKKVE